MGVSSPRGSVSGSPCRIKPKTGMNRTEQVQQMHPWVASEIPTS